VEGKVLTAGHVTTKTDRHNRELSPPLFMWEDGAGRSGAASGIFSHEFRDIGELEVSGDEPFWYSKATEIPKKGDKVYWVQFDKKDALKDDNASARVKYTRAGYLVVDKVPAAGSSGSCVFNDEGQVVGLIVWGTVNTGEGIAVLLEGLYD
jgi:V8-like Glu-specific endopeptidase